MRIIICDDDSRITDQLKKYLSDYFKAIGGAQPTLDVYSSGDELLAAGVSADIAFLDVEMPGRSGIKTSAILKGLNPQVIIFIITSYRDYLDDAMREQVFRFLDKPIDKNRLYRNLKEALYKYSMETKEIPVETENGIELLKADDIVCVETNGRKVSLYTVSSVVNTSQSIEAWADKLNLPSFYPVFRGIIINMRYVSKVNKDTIVLKYGEQTKLVYLARRKYTDFKDSYLSYLESVK